MGEAARLQKTDAAVKLARGASLHVQWLRHPVRPEPGRPVLVFLHEALGSVAMWKDVPAQVALASGCDALVYDRLGHGASDPLPPELNGGDYLERESWLVLPELLEACAVETPLFIGHSDGGTIALLAAARLPKVVGVVSEAAHLFVETKTLEGIRKVVEGRDVAALLEKLARYHAGDLKPIFNRWQRIWLSAQFADWNIETELTDVRCPVFALQGEDDEYGTAAQLEALAAAVSGPVETLLLPDCRHVPHFQQQEIYCREVLRFLRQCLPVG